MSLTIVTGASRGLGREIARKLAAGGRTVACIARSSDDLDTLTRESPRLLPVVADLTDHEALDAALNPLLDEHEGCDVLVNNAGYALRGAIEELDLDSWRHEFEVNVFACVHLIQRVVPQMRQRRRGRIINVSSVAGRISTPFNGGYAATKFALEAMNDALRGELRPFGVHVVSVQPGPVKTNFRDAAASASRAWFQNDASPYFAGYQGLRASMAASRDRAWDAERVADLAIEAIEDTNPKAVYAAHGPKFTVSLALKTAAPAVLDRILARRVKWEKR